MNDASIHSLVLDSWPGMLYVDHAVKMTSAGVPAASRSGEHARLGEGMPGASHKLAIPDILKSHAGRL